ncbi:MAG: hypothetical protein JWM44_1523 [Bacilli bacterium]|jgi:hypothetical protein|nr:hypothetical protein [Bacilli bacterium]
MENGMQPILKGTIEKDRNSLGECSLRECDLFNVIKINSL